MRRRSFIAGLAAAGMLPAAAPGFAQTIRCRRGTTGRPSRRSSTSSRRATAAGGADFVPVPRTDRLLRQRRHACGPSSRTTSRSIFAMDRVKALAPQHPEWKTQRALQVGDPDGRREALAAMRREGHARDHGGDAHRPDHRGVQAGRASTGSPRPAIRASSGLTPSSSTSRCWSCWPILRANSFKTFIVSGGGIEFMRPWTERIYGIPPEQVVGSSGVTQYEMRRADKPVLLKEAQGRVHRRRAGQAGRHQPLHRPAARSSPSAIPTATSRCWNGRRPARGARFMGLVHHTDAVREYAYDRNSPVGRLDKAWDEAVRRGWTVVDMKNDWKVIYPFEMK